MMRVSINVFVFITYVCVVFGQELDLCTTPTRITGNCISLADCNKLKPLIKQSIQSREYLKEWHCGFIGDVPKVCCPAVPMAQKLCSTVNGKTGYCIPIQACPALALKFSYFHIKENAEYLQKSRCFGETQQDMCCDADEQLDISLNLVESIFGKPPSAEESFIITKPKHSDSNNVL